MRRLTAVLAIVITAVSFAAPATAGPVRYTDACEAAAYLEKHGVPDVRNGHFRNIPCGEVNRAVSEAAREWRIDEGRFRRSIWCESKFHPFVGRSYKGLVQAGVAFWRVQVPRFNANLRPGQPPVLGNVLSPFDNARVGARVISREGYGQWSCKG